MKKTLKTVFSLIALSATLSACASVKEISEKIDSIIPVVETKSAVAVEPDGITKIELKIRAYTLLPSDQVTIETDVFPRRKEAYKLVYSTSDKNVATVDENGVITAQAAGKCLITVSNNTADVKNVVDVSVFNSATATNCSSNGNNIKTHHTADGYQKITKTNIYEKDVRYKVKNGKQQAISESNQTFCLDLEDAFFSIKGRDYESKCEGGNLTVVDWGYAMYVDQYFNGFIFRQHGISKNYMIISCGSYIGKGTNDSESRLLALDAIMDAFFVSGKNIFYNYLSYAEGYDASSSSNLIDCTGYSGFSRGGRMKRSDGTLYFEYSELDHETIDADDEDDIDIPAGTEVELTFGVKMSYENYVSRTREILFDYNYTLGDDSWQFIDSRKMTFNSENPEIVHPNVKEYTKVDSIYDL